MLFSWVSAQIVANRRIVYVKRERRKKMKQIISAKTRDLNPRYSMLLWHLSGQEMFSFIVYFCGWVCMCKFYGAKFFKTMCVNKNKAK